MDLTPDIYRLKEYEYLTAAVRHYQSAAERLETVTFSGAIAIYAALFGVLRDTQRSPPSVPPLLWWAISLVVLAAWGRSFSYYILSQKLGAYLKRIEVRAYSNESASQCEPPWGWETSWIKKGLFGPYAYIVFNMVCWALLFLFSISVSLAHTSMTSIFFRNVLFP